MIDVDDLGVNELWASLWLDDVTSVPELSLYIFFNTKMLDLLYLHIKVLICSFVPRNTLGK